MLDLDGPADLIGSVVRWPGGVGAVWIKSREDRRDHVAGDPPVRDALGFHQDPRRPPETY
jgi:hypothetical protein